jgi:hypothetical protein
MRTIQIVNPGITLTDRPNGPQHELALRLFMVIVLAHWAEHLLQAVQIYVLNWPVPEARGLIGYFYPWVIRSETLHYGYALVMLGPVGAADGVYWRPGPTLVDHRARDPVRPPLRASPADCSGDHRPQPGRPAGADEPRATLGASRRAAPVLQHHRLHSDGDRDALSHVSTGVRGESSELYVQLAQ